MSLKILYDKEAKQSYLRKTGLCCERRDQVDGIGEEEVLKGS